MKAFSVHLLSGAKEDLLSLHNYVVVNDSREKADELFDEIQTGCSKLKTMPHRGRVVPELERIGIAHEFRELILKPYRIIYSVTRSEVFVYCIFDGRRDLQDLLEERLLR
jgi:toxin ParE1/3/4